MILREFRNAGLQLRNDRLAEYPRRLIGKLCQQWYVCGMTTLTMNIALSDDLKSFVDARVKARGYSSTSEYMRDLVRKDEMEAARDGLRNLIRQGLESTPGPLMAEAITQFA